MRRRLRAAQQWRVGALIAAGTVIPLGLMLLNGDLLFIQFVRRSRRGVARASR
jgi:hypothetical protein